MFYKYFNFVSIDKTGSAIYLFAETPNEVSAVRTKRRLAQKRRHEFVRVDLKQKRITKCIDLKQKRIAKMDSVEIPVCQGSYRDVFSKGCSQAYNTKNIVWAVPEIV